MSKWFVSYEFDSPRKEGKGYTIVTTDLMDEECVRKTEKYIKQEMSMRIGEYINAIKVMLVAISKLEEGESRNE